MIYTTGIDGLEIVADHPEMIVYVDDLQRKNAECLSFYPKQVFERERTLGRILLAMLNGQPCGYVYFGSGRDGTLRCHQVCIQYDARRKLYGAALVARIETIAEDWKCHTVMLRCGFDLDANRFWNDMGYGVISVVNGGVRRMRRINVWAKFLQPQLFSPQWVTPETGKTSASMWARNRIAGKVSQFTRGSKMRQYREIIIASDESK